MVYADRLWQDNHYAQFFKGSPMLEVLDFLERLAPFSKPDLVVRDKTPSMRQLAKLEQVEEKTEKDSLQLLRESLGR